MKNLPKRLIAFAVCVAMLSVGYAVGTAGKIHTEYSRPDVYVDGEKIEYVYADGTKADAFMSTEWVTYMPVRAIAEALGKDVQNIDGTVYITTPSEPTPPPTPGVFNEAEVLKQLEVTEYKGEGSYYYYHFLAIKNNSPYDLTLSADIKFYTDSGALVGAENSTEYAFEAGTETVMAFSPDEAYTITTYELSVEEEDYYDCVVSDLSYSCVSAKDKEIVIVKNNGDKAAKFVTATVLFFKGDEVVYYSWDYYTDDDSEIKPGKSETREVDCYEDYDSIKVFLSGRAKK